MTYSMRLLRKYLCILVIGVFIAVVSGMPANAQGTRRIDVFSTRPLPDALRILKSELDCVITYEDPLWQDPSVLTEMYDGGYLVPKRGRLTFVYNLGNPKIVIKEVLNQYHQQIDTAQFELIVEREGLYNVVPVKRTNESGELVENRSILDVNISVSMQDVPYAAIMDEIFGRLSEKLIQIRPFKQLYVSKGSASWHGKNARSCINEILHEVTKEFPDKYSWHISRGPALGSRPAILNIHKVSPVTTGSGPWHVKVGAIRPLAEAIKILEEILGCTITYEDTLYLCSGDTERNRAEEIQRPRAGLIDLSYSPNIPADRVIRYCLSAYHNRSMNSGIFTMEKDGSVFHVFPIEHKDKEGVLMPHESILNTPISVSEQDKTPLDILRSISTKATEGSERKIRFGNFAQDGLFGSPKSFGSANKPARIALTEFVKTIGNDLSWQLLYDPRADEYVLNIHSVPSGK